MTLPFFGSGIVELPPEGFKRAKNSRKMQMVFFVHEGKVLVTVGPPAVEQNGRGVSGGEAETNEFVISKGGVWVVPRGMSLHCFSFPFLPSPITITPHCIAFQPQDRRSARARARKATPRHHRGRRVLSTHRPRSRKEEAVSSICQLIFKLEELEDARSEAVCATSRRNNLSIAPKHRTSCVSLHPCQGLPLLQAPYLRPFMKNPEELPSSDGVLHRRCQHAFCLRSHDIGATQLWGWLVWLLCDFARKILAGLFSCGAFACLLFLFLDRFWLHFSLGRNR